MPAKLGRPTEEKKSKRLEIRLTPTELSDLEYCAGRLGKTKTETINQSVRLLKSELEKE